jgi:hypothetical protein
MQIEDIPLEKIKPAKYNPRRKLKPGDHRYEVIRQSIREFDLVQPLVWNKRSGNLVGGHQRFNMLAERGDKTAPCVVVDLTPEKEKALNITLNNAQVAGEWDPSLLPDVLKDIELETPDLYDSLDMGYLASQIAGEAGTEDDDDALDKSNEEGGPPEMELLPYEHYDYIVLFFKNSQDFMAAADHFQLGKISVPEYVGKKKIGTGRVLDGAKYMHRVNDEKAKAEKKK